MTVITMMDYMSKHDGLFEPTKRLRLRQDFFLNALLLLGGSGFKPCKVQEEGYWLFGVCTDDEEESDTLQILKMKDFFKITYRDMQSAIVSGRAVLHDGILIPSSTLDDLSPKERSELELSSKKSDALQALVEIKDEILFVYEEL